MTNRSVSAVKACSRFNPAVLAAAILLAAIVFVCTGAPARAEQEQRLFTPSFFGCEIHSRSVAVMPDSIAGERREQLPRHIVHDNFSPESGEVFRRHELRDPLHCFPKDKTLPLARLPRDNTSDRNARIPSAPNLDQRPPSRAPPLPNHA